MAKCNQKQVYYTSAIFIVYDVHINIINYKVGINNYVISCIYIIIDIIIHNKLIDNTDSGIEFILFMYVQQINQNPAICSSHTQQQSSVYSLYQSPTSSTQAKHI